MRLENCAMAGIAVLIGFIVAGGLLQLHYTVLALAVVSAFLITGAGNAINDYYDRNADKKNAPHRPIPTRIPGSTQRQSWCTSHVAGDWWFDTQLYHS
jgi:geranylgeranylglycerol-phosphate geranylgeranyltransferase